MAASRVIDLTQSVTSQVVDHNTKMQEISSNLAGLEQGSEEASVAVFAAMENILTANTELQQRLAVAEKQLAEQAVEIKVHESEARTDSLTGLSNRRAFDDELKRRLSERQRKGTPCTLVLLDIDYFKKFNDTHGHQAGDEVLRQVGKVLEIECREMDLPCRYGGEEFGVILPATDAATACKVAERIRKAIENSTTVFEAKKLKVTCSLGLAEYNADDDLVRLIRRADDGLYASKKAGRNCGHWNTGSTLLPIAEAVANPNAAKEATPSDGSPVSQSESPDSPPADAALSSASGGAFVQLLRRRVIESQRFGVPLSVMCVKLEEYDSISRQYGLMIARQMTDAAASAIQKVLREMEVLAKLERGELVIMLPGSTLDDVLQLVKRMHAAAATCILPLVDRRLELRLRHGIAELGQNESAQDLLVRARNQASTQPAGCIANA